jgi:hypothetical protein
MTVDYGTLVAQNSSYTTSPDILHQAYIDQEIRRYLDGVKGALVTKEQFLASQGIVDYVSFNGKEVLKSVLTNAPTDMYETVAFVVANYSKLIRARRGSFEKMYTSVAQNAMRDTMSAYLKVRHSAHGYRRDERFSGGKMLNALRSTDMYLVGYDGLSFINTSHLDSAARQWYRLNFGAGAGEGYNVKPTEPASGGSYRVVMFGVQSNTSLSLNRFKASPNFYIPPGRFSNGESVVNTGTSYGDRFEVLRSRGSGAYGFTQRIRGKRVSGYPFWPGGMSKSGIAAQRFLDAGVQTIAREAPRGNEILLEKIAREALDSELGVSVLSKAAVTDDMLRGIQRLSEQGSKFAEINYQDMANYRRLESQVISYGSGGRKY